MTGDTWHVTFDKWHMTLDMWHMTCYMCTLHNNATKNLNTSILVALGHHTHSACAAIVLHPAGPWRPDLSCHVSALTAWPRVCRDMRTGAVNPSGLGNLLTWPTDRIHSAVNTEFTYRQLHNYSQTPVIQLQRSVRQTKSKAGIIFFLQTSSIQIVIRPMPTSNLRQINAKIVNLK